MRNLGECVFQIQSLLGDQKMKWVTRAYIVPFINITYATVYLNLKNASAKNLQGIVTIPNVPAGTQSLYPWQNGTAIPGIPTGGQTPEPLLAGLYDPIRVFVKPAGQSPQYYTEVKERDTLPHVNPLLAGQSSLGPSMFFTWEGNMLQITPVGQPLDIEVHGKFSPTPLAKDTDLLTAHEDVWIPTCWGCAATTGIERTNPAILAGYATLAASAQDNIVAELIRQRQATPQRFAAMARSSGRAQWYWS